MAEEDRVVRVRVVRWMEDVDGSLIGPGEVLVMAAERAMMLARIRMVEFVRDERETAVSLGYEKRVNREGHEGR